MSRITGHDCMSEKNHPFSTKEEYLAFCLHFDYIPNMNILNVLPSLEENHIDNICAIQAERGSVYGKFEAQCKCVGQIMEALEDCATENNKIPTPQQKGAFAYMAIKLARYAVSPEHKDTLVDLESYANLIKTMEIGVSQ